MCVTLQSNSRAKDNSDPSVIYNKIYGQEGLQIKAHAAVVCDGPKDGPRDLRQEGSGRF